MAGAKTSGCMASFGRSVRDAFGCQARLVSDLSFSAHCSVRWASLQGVGRRELALGWTGCLCVRACASVRSLRVACMHARKHARSNASARARAHTHTHTHTHAHTHDTQVCGFGAEGTCFRRGEGAGGIRAASSNDRARGRARPPHAGASHTLGCSSRQPCAYIDVASAQTRAARTRSFSRVCVARVPGFPDLMQAETGKVKGPVALA